MTVKRRRSAKAVPATLNKPLAYNPEFSGGICNQIINGVTTSVTRTYINSPDEDSDRIWIAAFTDGCRTATVYVNSWPSRILTEDISYTAPVQDDFNRTAASAWGNTDSSGKWSVRSGNAADYNVTPGVATMALPAVNVSRRIAPSSYGYNYTYSDTTVKVKPSMEAIGDSIYAGIMSGYQSSADHYLATLEFAQNDNMTEAFATSASAGWGNEDRLGRAWATSGGTSTDYTTVAGQYGQHSHSAVNVSRRTIVTADAATDGEVLMSVTFPTQPTGGSVYAGALLRYTDANNHYIVRLRKNYTGDAVNAVLELQKQVAGVNTGIDSQTLGVIIPINEKWWIKTDINGTTIRAKAWKDGTSEPGSWLINTTDSSLATGTKWGVRSILSTSNTNSFPYTVRFPSWAFTANTGDGVNLKLQMRNGGVVSGLGSTYNTGLHSTTSEWMWLRSYRNYLTGEFSAKTWKDGTSEPGSWQITVTDSTFGAGDVGLRGTLQPSYTGSLAGHLSWASYTVDARWSNPLELDIGQNRVYLLPTPFDTGGVIGGCVGLPPIDWIADKIRNSPPDIVDTWMGLISNAAPSYARGDVTRDTAPGLVVPSGTQMSGDCNYGPRDSAGARVEGSDFNDYLGVTSVYPSFTTPGTTFDDPPETEQLHSLDCSGTTRMTLGYHHGYYMQSAPLWTDDRLPRVSSDIASGVGLSGIELYRDATAPPDPYPFFNNGDIGLGDWVFFDADTSNPNEEEGQIDHLGMVIGAKANPDFAGDFDNDWQTFYYFISSRKTVNGPTWSEVGGTSKIVGTGLYGRSLRVVRRF